MILFLLGLERKFAKIGMWLSDMQSYELADKAALKKECTVSHYMT